MNVISTVPTHIHRASGLMFLAIYNGAQTDGDTPSYLRAFYLHLRICIIPLSQTMKFFALTSLICAAASALAAPANSTAQTASLTYSQQYDNPKISLNAYACSNGPHGFEAKGTYRSFIIR